LAWLKPPTSMKMRENAANPSPFKTRFYQIFKWYKRYYNGNRFRKLRYINWYD
jgi:hypothetical protein